MRLSQNPLGSLPPGWAWTTLSGVCGTSSGGTPSRGNSSFFGGGIPWIKSGELRDGTIRSAEETLSPEGLQHSNARLLPKGTLLVALYGATVGKLGMLGLEASTNQAVCAISAPTGFEAMYAFWYLYHRRKDLLRARIGGAQPNISQATIRQLDVPLCPTPEQRRIVAKMEELFSQLDAGVEELKKAKAQLKRYRQSVLKAAFEGKLTEEWRKKNLTTKTQRHKETAQDLLARIREERKKALGRKYKEPPPLDTSELPELPEGWARASTSDLFGFITSGSRGWAKYYSEEGPLFVRIGNLDHGIIGLDLSDVQRVRPPTGTEGVRTRVLPGDILVSITADVGMIALVPDGIEEAYINQHVSLARSSTDLHRPYLAWFLASKDGGQKQFAKLQRGATKAGLGLDDIRSIAVPFPPVPEQQRIVEEVERRLSIADAEEKAIEAALKQAARLRQSILKRAFEGRLVPQDPTDEPAERLLERIRAEKAKHAAGQPRGRGRRTATAGK